MSVSDRLFYIEMNLNLNLNIELKCLVIYSLHNNFKQIQHTRNSPTCRWCQMDKKGRREIV